MGVIMNFIIYEDDARFSYEYKKVIHKVMGLSSDNYKITEFNSYNKEVWEKIKTIGSPKIFIVDVEVPNKNGIDLARMIRKSGDWTSPIIVITNYQEFRNVGYTAKILMLDFINKKDNIKEELYRDLLIALEINSTKKALRFTIKGEVYQVPYQDILYIEKNINDNYATIVCSDKEYTIRKTICELEEELKDENIFVKSHRSFIVNINNIKSIKFDYSVIDFGNGKEALISRNNKKKLKEIMSYKNERHYNI